MGWKEVQGGGVGVRESQAILAQCAVLVRPVVRRRPAKNKKERTAEGAKNRRMREMCVCVCVGWGGLEREYVTLGFIMKI
jgi:hypothetical protein